jgi:hypothetical protein
MKIFRYSLIIYFFLNGCVYTYNYPKDITLESLSFAKNKHNIQSDIIKPDDIAIAISTSENFLKLANEDSYNIGSKIFFCSKENERVDDTLIEEISSLYISNLIIQKYKYLKGAKYFQYESLSKDLGATSKKLTYYIYFQGWRLHPLRYNDQADPLLEYNLKYAPRDICIYIRGAKMFGPIFKSNVVRITKEQIIELYKKDDLSEKIKEIINAGSDKQYEPDKIMN